VVSHLWHDEDGALLNRRLRLGLGRIHHHRIEPGADVIVAEGKRDRRAAAWAHLQVVGFVRLSSLASRYWRSATLTK
jgi:hypothetical protein